MNKIAISTTLRPALSQDIPCIAALWHTGWVDAHMGQVPEALLAHRSFQHHLERTVERIDAIGLALYGSKIVGFFMLHNAEIEQFYVDSSARGSGVAATLLSCAERLIRRDHEIAWLAVVAGNTRARRFYERNGWRDTGSFNYDAWTLDGAIPVPALRYEKRVCL